MVCICGCRCLSMVVFVAYDLRMRLEVCVSFLVKGDLCMLCVGVVYDCGVVVCVCCFDCFLRMMCACVVRVSLVCMIV